MIYVGEEYLIDVSCDFALDYEVEMKEFYEEILNDDFRGTED